MDIDEAQQNERAEATTIFRMPAGDATTPDMMGATLCAYPTLSIIKGPQPGVTFELDKPDITVGRDPSNDVFLNDMTVSRQHAHISLLADGTVTIEDLNSLNGTWVDGVIISTASLIDGSTVQVGTFCMVFHATRRTFSG